LVCCNEPEPQAAAMIPTKYLFDNYLGVLADACVWAWFLGCVCSVLYWFL
jgi:hypothetical protein